MLIGEVCGEGGGGGAGLRYYTLEHCLSSSAVMLTVVVESVSWRHEIGGKSCMEWRESRHAGTLLTLQSDIVSSNLSLSRGPLYSPHSYTFFSKFRFS